MMRHDVNQHATEATRRAGAYAAAEAKRQRRAQAKDIATEQLAEMTAPALARLEELLGSEDRVAIRAALSVLDRVLGRPGQAIESSGPAGAAIQIEPRHVTTLADVNELARELGMATELEEPE
jgi:hypothetical protein